MAEKTQISKRLKLRSIYQTISRLVIERVFAVKSNPLLESFSLKAQLFKISEDCSAFTDPRTYIISITRTFVFVSAVTKEKLYKQYEEMEYGWAVLQTGRQSVRFYLKHQMGYHFLKMLSCHFLIFYDKLRK